MELFAFLKFMANLVIAMVVLHLIESWLIRDNPDSSAAKALAFVTHG